jgi:hypothetical protein
VTLINGSIQALESYLAVKDNPKDLRWKARARREQLPELKKS